MPAEYPGSPAEFLWIAFKSGAPMPLGERHMRSILVSHTGAEQHEDSVHRT
jgi:hypothetical protein